MTGQMDICVKEVNSRGVYAVGKMSTREEDEGYFPGFAGTGSSQLRLPAPHCQGHFPTLVHEGHHFQKSLYDLSGVGKGRLNSPF